MPKKQNYNKNPSRNLRNNRRKRALIRAEEQLKNGGIETEGPDYRDGGIAFGLKENSEARTKQLEHEITVLKQRIVQ